MSRPASSHIVQVMIDGQTVDGSLALKDRTFRNAWHLDGGAISVDMDKARDIQRDKIRAERRPRLEQLDAAFMKALERSDPTSEIAALKEKLRNAPDHPLIVAAENPETLAALTIDVLIA